MTLVEKNNNEVLLSQGMLATRMREKPLMPGELFFNYSWQSLKDNKKGFASSEIWIGTLRPDHPIRVGGNGGLFIKGKYSEFFPVKDLETPFGDYTRTSVLPSEDNRSLTIGDLFIVDKNIIIFATEDNPRVNGGDVICYIGHGCWWSLSNSTISYNPPTRGSAMANIDYHDDEDIMMSLKSALDILFKSKADLDPYGKIYYDDLPDKIKQQVSGNIHYGNTQVIGDFEVKPSYGSVPLIATNTDPTNTAVYETLSIENKVETTELPPNTVRINGDVEIKGVYAPLVLGFENMLFGSSEDEDTQVLIIGTDDTVVNKGDFKIDGSFYAGGDVECADILCSNISALNSVKAPQLLVTGKIDGEPINGPVLIIEGKSSFKDDMSVLSNIYIGDTTKISDEQISIGENTSISKDVISIKSHTSKASISPSSISIATDDSSVDIKENSINIIEGEGNEEQSISLENGNVFASDTVITGNGIKIGETLISEDSLKYLLSIIAECKSNNVSVKADTINAESANVSTITTESIEVTESSVLNGAEIDKGTISHSTIDSPLFKGNIAFDNVSISTIALKVGNEFVLPTTPGTQPGSIWIGV